MYLILQMIGIVIFMGSHWVYGQDVNGPEHAGSDPSTMTYTKPEQSPQAFGGQNQVPARPQTSDVPQQSSPTEQPNQPISVDEHTIQQEHPVSSTPPQPVALPQATQPQPSGNQVPSVPPQTTTASVLSPEDQKKRQDLHEAEAKMGEFVKSLSPQEQDQFHRTVEQIETTMKIGDGAQPSGESAHTAGAQQAPLGATQSVQSTPPTSLPPMPQKEPKPKPPMPVIEEIKGINTVDLEESRGNWLFKRIWWERAEKKYEKIRLLVEKIIDSRMEFFEKRTRTDREILDPFYHTMGMDQGEMKTIVGQLIAQLQQERDKDGVLNAQERDLLQLLTSEKKSIEQLQGYVATITKLDVELDEALNKLLEQINAIRRYERDAWQQFKDIARVLSDTKARELYAHMEVVLANIQEVQEYLQEPFKEHFDHIINMITTHVDFIKNTVQALKEKGIDLQDRMKAQADKLKPRVTQEDQNEQDEEEQDEAEQGFIGRTMSAITGGFKTMWDYAVFVITWPYVKLFGSTQAESEQDEEEQEDEHSGSSEAEEQ
jgi:hypothetical protein